MMITKMYKIINQLVCIALTALLITACSDDDDYQSRLEDERNEINNYLATHNVPDTALQDEGIYYQELIAGEGDIAEIGDKVVIYYTGYLLDGQVFESNVLSGRFEPFIVTITGTYSGIGTSNNTNSPTISGWPPALLKMKKGTKARVLIPSSLAYGSFGSRTIPPYTPILFDIEAVDIRTP